MISQAVFDLVKQKYGYLIKIQVEKDAIHQAQTYL